MTGTLNQVTFYFFFIVAAILNLLALALMVILPRKANRAVTQWAETNGYQIRERQYRHFFRGPFFLCGKPGDYVWRLVVVDDSGAPQGVWLRTNFFVVPFSDEFDVRWDQAGRDVKDKEQHEVTCRKKNSRKHLVLLVLSSALALAVPCPAFAGPALDEAKRGYESCYFQLRPATAKERLAYALRMKRFPERHRSEQLAEARRISDRLERYIAKWLEGETEAVIPRGMLPDTIDNPKTKDWTLQRFEQIAPRRQWIIVPARPMPLDQNALMNGSADPQVTKSKSTRKGKR